MSDTLSEAAARSGLQTFRLVDAQKVSAAGEGCGCGGHGATGGCGCGGHGHAHRHDAATDAGAPATPERTVVDTEAGELDVHALPRVVRHQLLLHAVDVLPVGETLVLKAPHQPEPLFDHLRDAEAHYRVETIDAGPVDWRYRITRIS